MSVPLAVGHSVRVTTTDQNPDRQITAIRDALAAEPDRWFRQAAALQP